MILTGLVGRPVTHSIGQTVYNRFFSLSDMDAMYLSVDLTEENLNTFVKKSRDLFLGYNVTIPHKVDIMTYLDSVESVAGEIGAVNLVKNLDGKAFGYNTDYHAARKLFTDNAVPLRGKRVAIAGSGGVARTIIYHILKEDEASQITIISRNPVNAEKKLHDLTMKGKTVFEKTPSSGSYEVLVNCTPSGMWPNDGETPFSTEVIENCEAGIDLVYNPTETMFVKELQKSGKKTVMGSDFFIDQGLESLRILFQKKIDEALFRRVAEEVMEEL